MSSALVSFIILLHIIDVDVVLLNPRQNSDEKKLQPSTSKYPWSDNVAQMEFTTLKPLSKDATKRGLIEELRKGHIPAEFVPFINLTAVDELRRKANDSLDFIIRDEDVADVDDDDNDGGINRVHNDGNKTVIKVSSQAGVELLQHWLDQAVSGLMAAVVTRKINTRKLSKSDKTHHFNCTRSSKTVVSHAKCVVEVLDRTRHHDEKLKMYSDLTTYLRQKRRSAKILTQFLEKYDKLTKNDGMEVNRRAKRHIFEPKRHAKVKRLKSFELNEEKKLSPVSLIARHLTGLLRAVKNKNDPPRRWQDVISDIRSEGERINSKKKNNDLLRKKFSMFNKAMKSAGFDPQQALSHMGMEDILADDPILSDKERNAKERKELMESMTPEQRMMAEPIKLIRAGIKMGVALAGGNTTNFDERGISLISPRLMSIVPDELANDTVSLFSPAVLSLHGEGTDLERKLSLVRALKTMSDTGQEEWMNFVLEASGVTEAVGRIREVEEAEERNEILKKFVSPEGQPLYFTKENVTKMYGNYERSKIETFEELQATFSPDQMTSMNTTGYAVLSKRQLRHFYGPGSPFNNSKALQKFESIEEQKVPQLIEANIRQLADEQISFRVSRRKDIVLSPLLLVNVVLDPVIASQPIILSPVVLSSLILSPAVFGAVVLSPWVFVPVILSPRLLSPVILNPSAFVPVVLSPLALDPFVLSPGVGLPIILSPFVLSPFILSPQVLTPLILSPFCLSPFIIIPNALTPLILSPFVLSPLILSPPFVSAFVLTPYALSPIIASNGAIFTAVLSPSWLS